MIFSMRSASSSAGSSRAHAADVERREHAPGDGFAVQQFFVSGGCFDGVADGVAEVEDHAQAGFALVDADDFSLHAPQMRRRRA